MTFIAHNRLQILGVLWEPALAAVPALTMTNSYKLRGFLVVALLLGLVVAVTISGFTLQDPMQRSILMSPMIFPGSFFVALSAFLYTLVGGLLRGPFFGTLVERAASKEKERVR